MSYIIFFFTVLDASIWLGLDFARLQVSCFLPLALFSFLESETEGIALQPHGPVAIKQQEDETERDKTEDKKEDG